MLPWVLPFGLYMAFIALEAGVRAAGDWLPGFQPVSTTAPLWLYPVKTAVVLGVLVYFWPRYEELKDTFVANIWEGVFTLGIGVLVYLAWVRMDWSWAMQGQAAGYNPWQASAGPGGVLAGVRLFGASLVVPPMEELFWRSFLIRWLISPRFTTVPLGSFTPLSCIATIVLFGLEHHLWLAGMMAGAAYTLLWYKTRRLWPCILAHAITNLLLGIHVLATGEWQWW